MDVTFSSSMDGKSIQANTDQMSDIRALMVEGAANLRALYTKHNIPFLLMALEPGRKEGDQMDKGHLSYSLDHPARPPEETMKLLWSAFTEWAEGLDKRYRVAFLPRDLADELRRSQEEGEDWKSGTD